jgi:hypothetical protein
MKMKENAMDYSIDAVREPDGRWVATLPHIPGLVVYEQSQEEVLDSARKLSAILLGEDMGGGGRILAFYPGQIPESARPEFPI